MKYTLIVSAALLLALASCNKVNSEQEHPTVTLEFAASIADQSPDATKTSIDGYCAVNWNANDIIRYYSSDGGAIGSWTIPSSCHTAYINAEVQEEDQYFVATYGSTGISSNTSASCTLSGVICKEQPGTFSGTHAAACKIALDQSGSGTKELPFKNLVSYLRFYVYRDDVSYVTFTANDSTKINGNGKLNINFGTDTTTVSFPDGEGSATTKVSITGGAGYYFLATIPTTINGFSIKLYNSSDEKIGYLDSKKTITIARNSIVNLGTLEGRVKEIPEPVDLGLSVDWAPYNIGANIVLNFGDFFAWGETSPYYEDGYAAEPSIPDSCWKAGKAAGYAWGSYDKTIDRCGGGTTLLPKYDPATVLWGEGWRMPTIEEWDELMKACADSTAVLSNPARLELTNNGKTITIIGTGERSGTALTNTNVHYWSSTKASDDDEKACGFFSSWSSSSVENTYDKCQGRCVRPVKVKSSGN